MANTNWSTNEIEKRYSPELLKAVDYMTVRHEPKSGDYIFKKLIELLGEKGTEEVHDTVGAHLGDALYRVNQDSTEPLIKEDVLFIDLESKRIQKMMEDRREKMALLKPVAIGCALVVASGILRVIGLEGYSDLVLIFAGFGALFGGIASGQQWWDSRSDIKDGISQIDYYKKVRDVYKNK